jgi:hypothetical protein
MRRSEREATLGAIEHHVHTLMAHLLTAADHCTEWGGLGYPTSSLNGERGSDHDPVGAIVARGQRDVFGDDVSVADHRLKEAHEALQWLARFAMRHALTAERPSDGGLIDCANPACDRWMSGIGNDRPRAGRCTRCYMHLRRYGVDWPHHVAATSTSE